ncbi:MAG TPA: FAD-binding oxidoreductase [Candidatus Dormibacteraeota bacterium]
MTDRADVVIVGAGVMGCSLAFHLAKRGRRVVVFDRGAIGQGATAACAGGVRAQFSSDINIRIGMEAKRVLRDFEHEVGVSADFKAVGYLFLLTTEVERSRFHDTVRLQRRLGLDDVVELTPAQARGLVRGLNTRDLSGATGLLQTGDTVEGVRTTLGEILAPLTVICAGPWSAPVGALTGLALAIAPSRRHVFVTDAVAEIDRRSPMTIDFHTSFYFHPEGDGVLFGMGDSDEPPGEAATVNWSILERITDVAKRRWPPLVEARIKTAWAGLYENTPDFQPLVGPLRERPGLWIAAGFSGHGFMMGPVVGRWLAQWMVDGAAPADLSAFAPDRFAGGTSLPERNVV